MAKLQEFKKRDRRVRIYHKSRNLGVSASRNLGIKKARGGKVLFLDSDDKFSISLMQKCIDKINSESVESVSYGYANYRDGVVSAKHERVLKKAVYRSNNEIFHEVIPAFLGVPFDDVNEWILNGVPFRNNKEHTALWRAMLDMYGVNKEE